MQDVRPAHLQVYQHGRDDAQQRRDHRPRAAARESRAVATTQTSWTHRSQVRGQMLLRWQQLELHGFREFIRWPSVGS
jgi:hypothetical protein